MSTFANTTIQLRKSGVSGNVPASLNYGELALNYYDGKLYYKNASGTITYISSGQFTNSFSTMNVSGSLIFATSNTDTLNFKGANGIGVIANTTSKTITLDGNIVFSTANAAFDEANSAYSLAGSAYSTACSAYSLASTSFNAFTDTMGDTISGSTSQTVQFVGGDGVVITANPSTSQITITANSTSSGFPYIDLGSTANTVAVYGSLDLGTLS